MSRAAERLFITQPAMSRTLTRLRAVFDDPLFTRSSHGMQPTPRAEALCGGLREILGDIAQLVTAPGFDPGSYHGEVNIALSEYIGVALLPHLMERINTQAPRLSVRIITRLENQLEELALGNLDFVIHIKQAAYSPDYKVENLGSSALAILVRENHPLVGNVHSWDALSKFPLVKLYATSREQMEVQQNAATKIPIGDHPLGTLEISHLLTALEVLRQTESFMPAPAFLLQQKDATAGITALPLPPEAAMSVQYALVTHKRTANSPLHNWLWDQITCTIRDMRTLPERKLRQRITAGSADPTAPTAHEP